MLPAAAGGPVPKGRSPLALVARRFAARPTAMFGLVVIVLFVAIALAAPWLAPYDPDHQTYTVIRKAPSALHWFGTDENGRDELSRVIFGARATLLAGLVSVAIAAGVGVPLGLLAGFSGGWTDAIIGRLVDAMLACPFLILAIALAAFLGPSLTNAMIAIGITATPVFVRVARAATLDAAANDYVEAARALGNPPGAWRCGTCCPTSCRQSWCRPPWLSPWRSSPRPACRSWAWGSNRRCRPGARC